MYSFNQIFLIYNGEREFTSIDYSKLSVLQRLFSFMTISICPLSVLKRSGPTKSVRFVEVSIKRDMTV